jgi:hypothetical protein
MGGGNVGHKIALARWDDANRVRKQWTNDARVQVPLTWTPVTVSEDDKGGWRMGGGPRITLDPILTWRTKGGKEMPLGGVSIFTFTSKMSCASFSLPAGPPGFNGSCPAAQRSVVEHTDYEAFHETMPPASSSKYICDVCYAGKGGYAIYPSIILKQMATHVWTRSAIQSGAFADMMEWAIRSLFRPDARKVMDAKQVNPHFFRIHDAGDFDTPEYFNAWVEVARRFMRADHPEVFFWAPTRVWVFKKWQKIFADTRIPDNLTVRPSGLIVHQHPPRDVPGIDAGTMSTDELSAFEGRQRRGANWRTFEGLRIWECPAYTGLKKSCASEKCRVCWVRPEIEVNYFTH